MKTWGIYTKQIAQFALLNHIELNDKSQIHVTLEVRDEKGCPIQEVFQVVMGTCSGRTQYYEVLIDENGYGETCIHDVELEPISLSMADACGDPLLNQELFLIHYFVDGEEMQENYAKFHVTKPVHEVLIRLEYMNPVSFSLQFMRQNALGDQVEIDENEVFTYTLHTPTHDECITLNHQNNWQVTCNGLLQGIYELSDYNEYEGKVCCFLNEEVSDGRFLLEEDSTMILQEHIPDDPILVIRFACEDDQQPLNIHVVSNDHCYDEWHCLNEENNYVLELNHLENGVYSVQAENDSFCYRIDYNQVKNNYAMIQIEDDVHLIELIQHDYTPLELQGNLRIRKIMKDEYGMEVEPKCNEAFVVRVSGCGKDDLYYLNASNSWSVDIGCACNGIYAVEELCDGEYECCYRINRGCCQSEACVEVDSSSKVLVEIINKRRASGKLIISKYVMKEDGCWHRPDDGDVFYFSLRGFDYRNMITLNCENNWCVVVDELCPGCYELKEHGCEDLVAYRINHGCMCQHGRVCVEEGECKEIAVYNQMKCPNYGRLVISKWISCANQELIRPDATNRYEVMVESDHQMYSLCLHAGNGFCAILDELEEGTYRIFEVNHEACYLVDGKEEQATDCAIVNICGNSHEIAIINEEEPHAILQIEAVLLDGNGNRFTMEEPVKVCLDSCSYREEIELNECNGWCICLTDLPQGTYRITQLNGSGCLLRYVVNGVCRPYANVVIKDQDVHVLIENQVPSCMHNVTIRKFISDGEHRYLPKDQAYQVRIYNKCFDMNICLNKENGYCYVLADMPEGIYYVEEDGSNFMMYVNGKESDHVFHIDQSDVKVDIVNEIETKTRVCFEQHLVDENGCELPLTESNTFLLRNQYEECELVFDCENQFEQCMLLPCGVYKLCDELDGDITLCINGVDANSCCFEVGIRPLSIQIIRHYHLHHTLCVEKWIRKHGSLKRPASKECFEICLIHESGRKQYAKIHCDSGWCAVFDDLEAGNYEIKEAMDECYDASFIIDGKEQEMGSFVLTDHDMDIMLINTPVAEEEQEYSLTICKRIEGQGRPDEQGEYSIQIKGLKNKEVVLNEKNQFETTISLPKGTYQIIEKCMDEKQVSYYLNGKQLSSSSFVLEGNASLVAFHKKNQALGTLYLRAYALDEEGKEVLLDVDEVKVKLEGIGCDQSLVLSKQNQFQVKQSLEKGRYEITSETIDGYKRMYRINDGKLRPYALIYMCDDQVEVDIIYMKDQKGSLKISKYIKDESCGCLIQPQEQEVFQIQLEGEMEKTIILSSNNHFSETIMNLRSGHYVVAEVGNDAYHTTYLVDGIEQKDGQVYLDEQQHQVEIINHMITSRYGSLSLTKKIRGANDRLENPPRNNRYVFQVMGDQFNETVVLDQSNQFHMDLEQLPVGNYTIVEQDEEDVSYLVDGMDQGSDGCIMIEESKKEVIIVNNPRTSGLLKIDKVIRTRDQVMMKPQRDECFKLHITAHDFSEFYELNEANNWSFNLSLDNGVYVVKELTQEYDVSYVVDQQSETSFGNVVIQDDMHELQIINQERIQSSGSIAIMKKIRNQAGELEVPNPNAVYDFLVSAVGFQKKITLNQENDFQVNLTNLPNHTYVIVEQQDQATYQIDGGSEVDYASVVVKDDSHKVIAINEVKKENQLHIDKVIRNVNGELMTPLNDERFQIHISKAGYNEYFELNETNQWSLDLTLSKGLYHIEEVNDQYDVSYVVDGQSEVDYANVMIQDEFHHVQIINSIKRNLLHISKVMREASGEIHAPLPDQSFQVQVLSSRYEEFFLLNKDNQFSVDVALSNGLYRINEISDQYEVSYIVDGQSEVGYASVRVEDDYHHVQIMNEEKAGGGSLLISKYVRDENGEWVRPNQQDRYEISVSSSNFYQMYTLDAENLFTETIEHLPSGVYDVRESGAAQGVVHYIVDSGAESEDAKIVIDQSAHTVRILNEQSSSRASIQLMKFIRVQDEYKKPQADEVFTIRISGAYETDVVLDVSNNWDFTVNDLPQGDYKVEEITKNYPMISYSLNGNDPLPVCDFSIVSNSRYLVGIINRKEEIHKTTVKMVLQ